MAEHHSLKLIEAWRAGREADLQFGVAFSGGRDSLALLQLMVEGCGAGKITALHIDHGVRDTVSRDEEMRAVERSCRELDVGWFHQTLNPAPDPPSESALRDARYRLLAAMAREHRLTAVVTAHHREDQLETVLMNLLRGTDWSGLAGMPESFERHGVTFLRPLLEWSGERLRQVVAGHEVFEDPSNADGRYRRNRYRRRLLPLIDELEPGWRERVFGLSQAARETAEFIAAEAGRHFSGVEFISGDVSSERICPRPIFREAPRVLTAHWWHARLSILAGGASGISRPMVNDVVDFVISDNTGYYPDMLPGGWQLRARKGELVAKLFGGEDA